MTDSLLRELERRFRETSSTEDELTWLLARARAGEKLDDVAFSKVLVADPETARNYLRDYRGATREEALALELLARAREAGAIRRVASQVESTLGPKVVAKLVRAADSTAREVFLGTPLEAAFEALLEKGEFASRHYHDVLGAEDENDLKRAARYYLYGLSENDLSLSSRVFYLVGLFHRVHRGSYMDALNRAAGCLYRAFLADLLDSPNRVRPGGEEATQ